MAFTPKDPIPGACGNLARIELFFSRAGKAIIAALKEEIVSISARVDALKISTKPDRAARIDMLTLIMQAKSRRIMAITRAIDDPATFSDCNAKNKDDDFPPEKKPHDNALDSILARWRAAAERENEDDK